MCGIFAYNGKENSIPLLIEGLRALEYRGYDSAGILSVNNKGKIFYKKAVGKVSVLATEVEKDKKSKNIYKTGIAHTRWATHGTVTKENTHPHHSSNNRFYLVHNGIIENYKELKKDLEKKYKFYSDTDTEVIVKLIEDNFKIDLKTTIEIISKKLVGAYSLAVIDIQNPKTIVGIKLGSPLVLGEAKEGIFISSDVNALSLVAHSYISLDDNEIVVIKDGRYSIFNTLQEIKKDSTQIDLQTTKSELGGFSSFTEKEIFEIPNVLENVFNGRIDFESKMIKNDTLEELNTYNFDKIEIIASGSSYFAGYMGCYYFKELASIKSEVVISSEFLCDTFLPNKKTLYIFLSQSGETADVRESLKIVKAKGGFTFGIVNVVGSTIAKLADMGLFSHAGVEIGVASTKNVIAQIAVLLMMAISMGMKGSLQPSKARLLIEELSGLGDKINKILLDSPKIKKVSKKYTKYKDMFVLGRNLLYPTAGEVSLKCKELSYIHTEAYSTGELKHGPLALVGPNFPCIVLNPDNKFFSKNVSNIKEIRARKGRVLGIITKNKNDKDLYDDIIELPEIKEQLNPFLCLTSMYLFALYLAEELGRDVDKPRNLAKSVTVE